MTSGVGAILRTQYGI